MPTDEWAVSVDEGTTKFVFSHRDNYCSSSNEHDTELPVAAAAALLQIVFQSAHPLHLMSCLPEYNGKVALDPAAFAEHCI